MTSGLRLFKYIHVEKSKANSTEAGINTTQRAKSRCMSDRSSLSFLCVRFKWGNSKVSKRIFTIFGKQRRPQSTGRWDNGKLLPRFCGCQGTGALWDSGPFVLIYPQAVDDFCLVSTPYIFLIWFASSSITSSQVEWYWIVFAVFMCDLEFYEPSDEVSSDIGVCGCQRTVIFPG